MAGDSAAARFLESIGPLLAQQDYRAATRSLRREWPADQLTELLSSPHLEVVAAVILSLGLVGSMRHCRVLLTQLRHRKLSIVRLAEDALWRIFMRAGSPRANFELANAVGHIQREEYGAARTVLCDLTVLEPTFAEAYHQRAIACCFLERLEEAGAAYRQALRLNPYHFSAAAGLGHVFAQRGEVLRALQHYRQALQIHPRLEGIPEAVAEIESAVRCDGDSF